MLKDSALRTLFSRPETVLLDQLIPDEMPYWRKVLRYCAWASERRILRGCSMSSACASRMRRRRSWRCCGWT